MSKTVIISLSCFDRFGYLGLRQKVTSSVFVRQSNSFKISKIPTSATDQQVSSIENKQPNPIRKGYCTHGMR